MQINEYYFWHQLLRYLYISQTLENICLKVRDSIWGDLTRFGKRAVVDIYPLGRECELNQPFVRPFDAWGNRTDELGKIRQTILDKPKLKLIMFYCFQHI